MRAILINTKNKTVTEVEYTGDYRNIYTHIEANCFDLLRITRADAIYVDDNGLLNDKGHTHGFFRYGERDKDNGRVLAGFGLILAHDGAGECVDTDLTLEYVKARVQFGEPVRMGPRIEFIEYETHHTLGIVL